jgi:putative membrane protein
LKTYQKPVEVAFVVLFSLAFGAGIPAHGSGSFGEISLQITETLLFITNLLALVMLFVFNPSWRLAAISSIILVVSFLVEAAGVNFGWAFGNYTYGQVFSKKLWGVPFIISMNWLVLILACHQIAKKWTRSPLFAAFLCGILIVIFDYFMEPVAIYLNYWGWENIAVPWTNYVTWFVLAFASSYLLSIRKVKYSSLLLEAYFFIQFIFFIGIKSVYF